MCELWLGALVSPALVWLLPSVSPAAAIELLSPQFPSHSKLRADNSGSIWPMGSIPKRRVRFTIMSTCLPWQMAQQGQNVSASCLHCSPDSGKSIFKQKHRSHCNLSVFRKQMAFFFFFFCHNAKQTFAQALGFLSLKLSAQQAPTFSLLFGFPHFSPVIDSMKKCLS